MVVRVHTGSHSVRKGTKISIQTLRGLQVKAKIEDTYGDQAAVELPDGEPFTEISATVFVRSELNNRKDSSTIEHKIQIRDPWSSSTKVIITQEKSRCVSYTTSGRVSTFHSCLLHNIPFVNSSGQKVSSNFCHSPGR